MSLPLLMANHKIIVKERSTQYLDFYASDHMAKHKSIFIEMDQVSGHVTFEDESINAHGIGTWKIMVSYQYLKMKKFNQEMKFMNLLQVQSIFIVILKSRHISKLNQKIVIG